MKLSEEMKNKTLLSFELFPPKTEKGLQNLPGTIDHLMKYNPSYISCTYGAGGGKMPELHRLLISPLSKTQKKESKSNWISIWLTA